MKVADQSCSHFKVAKVAKVADARNSMKTGHKLCKFKVADQSCNAFPPLIEGELQLYELKEEKMITFLTVGGGRHAL